MFPPAQWLMLQGIDPPGEASSADGWKHLFRRVGWGMIRGLLWKMRIELIEHLRFVSFSLLWMGFLSLAICIYDVKYKTQARK